MSEPDPDVFLSALRKQPRGPRGRATVDAMLDAAAKILVEEGYDRLNTNHVAEVAGTSVGSLYQYFGNKQALVGALLERHAREELITLERIWAEREDDPSFPAVTRDLIRALIAAQQVEPELTAVITGLLPMMDPELVRATSGIFEQFVLRCFAEYPARMRPDLDPGLAAFIIVHSLEKVTHLAALQRRDLLEDNRLADELTRMVVAYLGSEPA